MGGDENMKILCVIDSLGSGGAQRQMVNLTSGLKAKGHDVELCIYHPKLDFYRSMVDEAGIWINEIHGVSGFSFKVVRNIAKLLRQKDFEVVISFLPSPNVYVLLASFLSMSTLKIIVSERNSHLRETNSVMAILRRLLYLRADFISVNSYDQKKSLNRFKFLRNKLQVIYNGYSFGNWIATPVNQKREALSFLVIGRNSKQKNGVRLVQALVLFQQRNGFSPNVNWAGRQEQDHQSLLVRAEMDQIIASNPSLQASWQWLGERSDIPHILANNDALIHVSLYEGLPNVVCEAFIAGRPVIASAVSDHPLLIENGTRGLLCDPVSLESICEALERFIALSLDERQEMGRNARQYAEERLTLERMVNEYQALLK